MLREMMPQRILHWTTVGAMAGLLALSGCGGGEAPAPEAAAPPAEEPAAEFVSIFDGQSLEGWELLGQTGDGYLAADGVLSLPPGGGGNLFYDKELTDFVVRFEFKLEDGSNNGLCIRCPKQDKSLAYEGIELQIIDNNAERYKDIETWQKHGSLYHVFPAKTGALKPTGEWNLEEVTVQGTKVKVVVNGQTILDVDTSTVTDPEVLEKHPGLKRTSGYIGFLGHNEPVEFRNIEVKEL